MATVMINGRRQAAVREGLMRVVTGTIEFSSRGDADIIGISDDVAEAVRQSGLRDGNGHSHVRAGLVGPSLTVPFVDGRLMLGRYQTLVFCDFDARPRERRLTVQVMGV